MSAIEIRDVEFSYADCRPVLAIDRLDIKEGEKVFFHGASGSGKSTLLNILAGILRVDKGSMSVLGTNLADMRASKRDVFRGDHIGYIFQNFNLIPYLTVYENIILPRKTSRRRGAESSSSFASFYEKVTDHLKIAHLSTQRVTDLSLGQQQRVAVARALVGKPELVIADEPTSALDDEVTESFMELLIREHASLKFTLLFVSHDRRLERYFDRSVPLASINNLGGN